MALLRLLVVLDKDVFGMQSKAKWSKNKVWS